MSRDYNKIWVKVKLESTEALVLREMEASVLLETKIEIGTLILMQALISHLCEIVITSHLCLRGKSNILLKKINSLLEQIDSSTS